MWKELFFILSVTLTTLAIKVPVDNDETPTENTQVPEDTGIDSYLIPPDSNQSEEISTDFETPATYLLPPSSDKQTDYYYPQADQGWYPISAQVPDIKQKLKGAPRGRVIAIPADHLEPPLLDAPDDYTIPPPSEELELPAEEIIQEFSPPNPDYTAIGIVKQKLQPVIVNDVPLHYRVNQEAPTLASLLVPPKPVVAKYKNPTKLYPKKYPGFKPVQIPIFVEADEVPRAKPLQIFNPNAENDYVNLSDEKKRYLFEQYELKRKLKEEEAAKQQTAAVDTYGTAIPTEQETSETFQRYPGRPVPIRQAPVPAPTTQQESNVPPPSDDRTEFRMHGMKGPHSYQFGYDTGKGKNRQFRYEERDNDGHVKGHYGYMDKHGKLRVVNYRAHPEHGFEADAPVEKQ